MATVIDALLVTLDLDGAKFKKGLKDATEDLRGFKNQNATVAIDINVRAQQMAAAFAKIRNEILGLFAVFTAGRGLQSFTRDISSSEAALGRLATNIGVATETLDAWQGAAQRTGGSAAATGASLNGLSQSFQQLQLTGQSSVVPYFRALNVSIADARGNIRPLDSILLDLSDKFSKMSAARAQAMGAGLGLDTGTINLLREGRAGVEGLLRRQRELGVTTAEDARRGMEFNNSLLDMSQVFRRLGQTIVNEFTPYIKEAVNWVTKWFMANREKITAGFIAAFEAVRDVLRDIDWEKLGTDIKEAFNTVEWKAIGHGIAEFAKGVYHAGKAVYQLIKALAELVGRFGGNNLIRVMPGMAGLMSMYDLARGLNRRARENREAEEHGGPAKPDAPPSTAGRVLRGAVRGAPIVSSVVTLIERMLGKKKPIEAEDISNGAIDRIQRRVEETKPPPANDNQPGVLSRLWTWVTGGRGSSGGGNAPAPSAAPPSSNPAPSSGSGGFWTRVRTRFGFPTPANAAPTGNGTAPAAPVAPTPAGQIGPNARYIHDQFIAAGYTEAQTAGMLGHIRGESFNGRTNDYDTSSYNPAGGNHGAQGIGQWRGARVDRFIARYGHEPRYGTIQEQTEFMLEELRTTERQSGAALRNSTTAGTAAERMVRMYGRPSAEELPVLTRQRTGWAEGWQRTFQKGSSAAMFNPGAIYGGRAANNDVFTGLPSTAPGSSTRGGNFNTASTDNSSSMSFSGPITIHTAATDAKGMMKDLRQQAGRSRQATSANSGLA